MASKKVYSNEDRNAESASFKSLMKWQKERSGKKKDLSFKYPSIDKKEIEFIKSNRSTNSITWIGHSTFLIQLGGLNIITDPVWANIMGAAKRLSPPGLDISDLPDIDIVLISHNHYDHLNFKSIKGLKGDPCIFVPEGLEKLLTGKGFKNVEEFSWWKSKKAGGVEISFVPAQHWSKRTLWDTNLSHWGGWVVKGPSDTIGELETETVYFGGDSGYFKGLKNIGEKYDIDYALLPIGCYEPEWFMGMQHMTPEQAVQTYMDVKAEKFVPMHFEAYRLADDTPKEALDRLLAEWERRGIEKEKLKVLKLGETLRI